MGTIRGVESLALALLRLIGEEARKDRTVKVIAQLPVEVATYLMNEKREWLNNIEAKTNAEVVLVPNKYLETPAYEIRRVRDDEAGLPENNGASHLIPVTPVVAVEEVVKEVQVAAPTPAVVSSGIPTIPPPPSVAAEEQRPAPVAAPEPQIGIFVKLWRFFFGGAGTDVKAPAAVEERPRSPRDSQGRRERTDNRQGRSRDRYGRDQRGGGDRDRNRARPDAKPKPAHGQQEHRRDAQHGERKPREAAEGRHDTHKQQPQTAAPAASASNASKPEQPPRADAGGENQQSRGERGERGERGGRNRRGRRRRGGRGREEGAPNNAQDSQNGNEGGASPDGAPRGEGPAEGSHNAPREPRAESRPTPQQSFDLPNPSGESRGSSDQGGSQSSAPAPTADAGRSASSFTVWSSGPSSGSTSWGSSSTRRDE